MSIKDVGPHPQSFDLKKATRANKNYRAVVWSGRFLQVTLMSIPAGGSIGLEMHPDTDQFLRLDAGRGRAQLGPSKSELTFDKEVSDGWCVVVPAGTWHNVANIGKEPMQLYAIYAPAHHKPGKIHKTAAYAAADRDDEPAEWSVQPEAAQPDKHALAPVAVARHSAWPLVAARRLGSRLTSRACAGQLLACAARASLCSKAVE